MPWKVNLIYFWKVGWIASAGLVCLFISWLLQFVVKLICLASPRVGLFMYSFPSEIYCRELGLEVQIQRDASVSNNHTHLILKHFLHFKFFLLAHLSTRINVYGMHHRDFNDKMFCLWMFSLLSYWWNLLWYLGPFLQISINYTFEPLVWPPIQFSLSSHFWSSIYFWFQCGSCSFSVFQLRPSTFILVSM